MWGRTIGDTSGTDYGFWFAFKQKSMGSKINGVTKNRWGQSLRSPLKVATLDDHNATAQELHPTRAAGMLPSHVGQVAAPG